MIKEAEKHQKGACRGKSWRDERNNDRRSEDNYRQKDGMLNDSKNIRDGREKEINRRWERSKDRDDERNRGRTGYKGSNNNKDEDASTSRKADRQQRTGFQRPCSGSDSEASPPRSFVRAPKDDDTNEKQPSHFHSNRQQYHSSESRTRHAQSEGKQQEKGRSPNNNLPRWKKKTEFEASQCGEKDDRKKKTEDGESLGSRSRNSHKLASSSSSGKNSSVFILVVVLYFVPAKKF